MNRFTKYFSLGVAVAFIAAMVVPTLAQDSDPGQGNGGIIIQANTGGDPSTFNPINGGDTVSSSVYALMYPDIIGFNWLTLQDEPNVPQGLATGWEYDETGTVVTISLREDAFWSDGEQITVDDWLWAYNAVKSGLTESPRTYVVYQLDDGTISEGPVHSATKIDDFTLEVKLGNVQRDDNGEVILDENGEPALQPNCIALSDINDIAVVPEHIFSAAFGEDYAAMNDDPYFVPTAEDGTVVTFGPFTDPFIEFGVQTSLLGASNYADGRLGYVAPEEWLLQNVEDQTVAYERFLAGDFTWLSVSADNQNATRDIEGLQIFEYPARGYAYMGYNMADPENPQPGRDEEGNLVDQGLHPIFSDVLVRQAIAYGLDLDSMIGTRPEGDTPATGILEGNGARIATHTLIGKSSTQDELDEMGVVPYPFDPARADELLTEAGWVDSDGDGVRECVDCLYAREGDASFAGSPLEFDLITNAGNVIRERSGETIKAQLEELGFIVNYQTIEWGALLDAFYAQDFDALIIGWSVGLPFTPDLKTFFGVGADIPGSGFNYVSYQDPELDALMDLANSLPAAEDGSYAACDPDQRDMLYAEGQRQIWEDQPYLFLYAANVMDAAQANVENWDPTQYGPTWNIDELSVSD